nr:uncharacterized protein LOC101937808 isoform X2 [Chrysemys picta bellii]
MILSLCLFLPALSPSSQETCSAPGALPAPIFYLKQTFPREGDAVLLQCSVFSRAPATRIIFCKDGEEISSQRGLEEKITYSYLHAVSRGSSGNYSCGYEIKESNNWVNRSQLSPAKYLSVTGHGGDEQSSTNSSGGGEEPTRTGLDLKLPLGITIPAVVVLAVVLYLLGKKGNVSTYLITLSHCLPVASLLMDQRERVQRSTSNTPEDHIEYASVNWLGSSRHPRPQREETPTYATIALQQDRCH